MCGIVCAFDIKQSAAELRPQIFSRYKTSVLSSTLK